MKRFATAMIALLALVALVTAAGSFDPTDQPQVDAESTPGESALEAASGDVEAGDRSGATQSSNHVDSATRIPPDSGDGGGISWLVVAALVGGLVATAVLAVVLTGDDARAPPREGDDPAGDEPEPTIPAVEPTYDSPTDNPAVRAWRRLSDRVGGVDDSTTPREVASEAVDCGVPARAVEGITTEFETVRYGSGSPTGAHAQCADNLTEQLDATAKRGTGTNDDDDPLSDGGDDA